MEVEAEDVLMTCGAAGALNVALKALLDRDDEVLTPVPCFVEYKFYANNHGGVLQTVPSTRVFQLDLLALRAAITPRTKVVLINSPNNPTGAVYSAESLQALGEILEAKGREYNRTIYLISDEPYRKVVYDGVTVPSIFTAYRESIIGTSYSKDISIPGERIGFAAVNPLATHRKALIAGMALANRILGFVNAPALMQRVVACLQGQSVRTSAPTSASATCSATAWAPWAMSSSSRPAPFIFSPGRRSPTTSSSCRRSRPSGSWRSPAAASTVPGTSASRIVWRMRSSAMRCRALNGPYANTRSSSRQPIDGKDVPGL